MYDTRYTYLSMEYNQPIHIVSSRQIQSVQWPAKYYFKEMDLNREKKIWAWHWSLHYVASYVLDLK